MESILLLKVLLYFKPIAGLIILDMTIVQYILDRLQFPIILSPYIRRAFFDQNRMIILITGAYPSLRWNAGKLVRFNYSNTDIPF